MSVGSRKFAEGQLSTTLFFCTAEQDELKTLLRNFALYTAVNLKAEVHTVELLRINLDEMWSDKFPIGIPIQIKGCAICHGKPYPSIRRISGVNQLVLRRQQSRLC